MYSGDEVSALLEWWLELRHSPRLWILVRYADLSSALDAMPPKEYRAVLLVALLQLSQEYAAEIEGVSQMTISRRLRGGIDFLADHMNGGYTYQ